MGSQSVLELDSNLWIVVPLCPIHIRDDLVDLILLLFRKCHQHQLRVCYSCSLICMFLYICFSRYFSTTEFTAMECDVSAYVVLIICNSSCFLHKVHQFQLICYYQSVWRGGRWSKLSAVWESSLPVSSQVSLKFEDLQEVHVVQKYKNGTCNLLMKKWIMIGSCVDYFNREREVVPIWIASTGREK